MSDRIETLERLARLHAEGKLSDAEFAQAKSRAIDGGRGGPPWWVWVIGAALIVLVALAAWLLSPVVPAATNTTETTMPRASDTPEGNFSDYAMPAVVPTPAATAVPTPTPGATPTPTPSDTGWAGRYEGAFDGGDGSLTIAPRPGGRLAARLDVAAPGCVGEFAANARDTADDRIILTRKFEESDEEACTIRLERKGDRIDVDESDCLAFHGAACGFSGSLSRR